jgi:zinc protease
MPLTPQPKADIVPKLLLSLATGLLALLLAAAPLSAAEEKAVAVPLIAPNAVEFTLDNGMPVVVIPDHRMPVVTHMVWYRVGAADEASGETGVAHFLEHLMFKGTKLHAEGEFSRIVASLGGEENAFTSYDYTGYYQRVAPEHLAEMMRLEADRMTNLMLTDDQVATERDVVMEERLEVIENDPSRLLEEAMDAALYRNHPYGRPVIGWLHEIQELDRDTALAFYNRYYAPNNTLLVVAGDVSPEEVRQLAQETYGEVPPKPERVRTMRPAEPPQVGPRTVTVRHERIREPMIQRAYLVPSSRTALPGEAEALHVLADILGRGPTSRLYHQLVRGTGQAVQAGAYYQSERLDDTQFVIYAVPGDGVDLRQLEAAMDDVIAELKREGITQAELQRAKNTVIAEAIYSQDSQETLAQAVGTALVVGHSLEAVQTWARRINEVTTPDIQAVAIRYLDENRSVTGYLEPRGGGRP